MRRTTLCPRARFGRILALLLAAAAAPLLSGAGLRVAGSDLLGAEFSTAVRDFARRSEVELTLALDGSRTGLAQLESGGADLGLLVLRPDEEPPATLFKAVPFAYQVVVVLVPASSPLAQITFRELRGIYGAAESVSFTRWGDLGLTGEWATRAIAPQALRPATGLSLELFRRIVLADGKLRSVAVLQPSADAAVRRLATDEGGIAITGGLPAGAIRIRALPVARADRDVAFGPTPENVHAGDYPLRLPVWLVIRRDSARAQLNLLRFLLSDEVASSLERAGFVTPTRSARNQLVFDLEQL